ncbi:MAG: GNAT family N-acetyltransferase [Chitinivibrionales bacterium]|nr:GNAT family N-acetyltransferase [Chitinivibrionales bacterium]
MHDLPILKGASLYLGPMPQSQQFYEEYASWLSIERVQFGIDGKGSSAQEAQEMIEQWRNDPTNRTFCIFDAASDQPIGDVCLRYGYEEYDNDGPETAIMVAKMHGLGKGYEAMKLLLNYGFNMLSLTQVNLSVYQDNTPAVKLYLKTGFSIVRSHTEAGSNRQEYIMLLTREHWDEMQAHSE